MSSRYHDPYIPPACLRTCLDDWTELTFETLINIRFDLIKKQLNKRARIALHGTNGFPPDLMRKCIEAGATKINVNRIVLDDYYAHLRSEASKMKSHTTLIEEGVEKIINQTVEWMEIIGSAGKAPASSLPFIL